MPFEGFICDANGREVTGAGCLACAEEGSLPGCNQTAPVIRGILDNLRPDDFGYTPTMLLGCPRRHRLMAKEPYLLKPVEHWWAYRGTLMHGVSAAYAGDRPNVIAERRFQMTVDLGGESVEVSGQPDLVYVDHRHLLDYKTTNRIPGPWRQWVCPETGEVMREQAFAWRNKWMDCPHCGGKHEAKLIERVGDPRPYPHHVQQVSLYRLLLDANGIAVETAEIVYMDMRRLLRVPVELLPLEAARALLLERLRLHRAEGLPAVLEGEAAWQCNYCPVREYCEWLHGGRVGGSEGDGAEN